ncbi:ribosomal protein L17 [Tilletiaria anomala UBC 951]|uniref:Ribosomal protein L17 n=1 Tax=Tilletiaria anomala (strain ATCC 24038 / CBS 436.72 / UBC 951) TaxID=1037660 RepID=A0A066W018_TILAU|nr:ribosomal protein L17 [Tilletiaria anomala UBC 951]KDN44389.1 ribosomal protein L17 [Tilletiaria anomala UBC 951]
MKNHAFRKLSRTSSHRRALLRNLVTSLFEHGRIVTTVAKAKEAAREAEKVITLGKNNTAPSLSQAGAFLFSQKESMRQLKDLAQRYAERPGGYTRIHLNGNRKGDHAPRAILELVDNPRDLRLEMTARAIARETLRKGFGKNAALVDYVSGKRFSAADFSEGHEKRFALLTAKNIKKVTQFGGEEARERLALKANAALLWLRAEEAAEGERRVDTARMQGWHENAPRGSTTPRAIVTRPYKGRKWLAGEEERGSTGVVSTPRLVRKGLPRKHSVIRIGKGEFAKRTRARSVLPPMHLLPQRTPTRSASSA